MVRQIEVGVKALQRPHFLLVDLLNLEVGKDHAAGLVFDMRQGQEPLREQVFGANLGGGQGGQLLPGQARRQFDPDSLLDGLAAAGHHHARGGPVAQVIAYVEQGPLTLHHLGLGRDVARPHGGKVHFDHRHVRRPFGGGLRWRRLGRPQVPQQ
jgi:hypothetical protein